MTSHFGADLQIDSVAEKQLAIRVSQPEARREFPVKGPLA
jgi:hypothetical protein